MTCLLPSKEEDLLRDCGWDSDYEALRELNCTQKKAVMILYGEMLAMDIVRLRIRIRRMLLQMMTEGLRRNGSQTVKLAGTSTRLLRSMPVDI